MTIDMRALCACVFVCAAATPALAPAESVRKSIDLQEMQAAAGGSEIKQAFVRLGMEEKRAACYEEVLAQQLSPEEQQEAAQIVSSSSNADEVKTNVVSAGPTIMGGFSAADVKCPEGMGS